jgi:ATP-dependent RNA helicase DeaD
MQDFKSLGLPDALLSSLDFMNYSVPTPIQSQTIIPALAGKDVLGTAQTGTGKTGAYGIPLVSYLLNNPEESALVLTPTRELATQVLAMLTQMLGKKSGIRTALIIGGDPMSKQLQQLHCRPRLIVGTPGRLNDHLDRKTLKLSSASFLVLDETDRMLDMGFGIQLEEIAKFLPKKRQTLMFSATLPHDILKLVEEYTKDAVRVSIGSTIAAADTIKQEIIKTSEAEKHEVLLNQLELREGTTVIFVGRKSQTEKLANKLRDHGHSADAIHGDLRQRNREKVIRGFRNKKYRILVATDVAARGLDIPHLELVVNYDLPQCEEDFIHRIGRTGRAGVEGSAVSLIAPQDHSKWRDICKMMDPNAKIDPSFADPRNNSKGRSSRGSKFGRSGGSSFKPRGESRFERSDGQNFKPRGDSRFGKSEGQNFKPRGDSRFERSEGQNFKPRGDSRFGRSDGQNFKPRGDSRFERSEGQNFKPRNESRFERSDGQGFKPRGDSRFGRSDGQNFTPRGDSRFGKSEGQNFKPRNESRFEKSDGQGFKPRGDSRFGRSEGQNFKPRNESRFERSDGQGFKPRGDSRFEKSEGQNFKPRGDSRFEKSEGQNFKPRGDSRFGRSDGQNFKPRNDSKFGRSEEQRFKPKSDSESSRPRRSFKISKKPSDSATSSNFNKKRNFS